MTSLCGTLGSLASRGVRVGLIGQGVHKPGIRQVYYNYHIIGRKLPRKKKKEEREKENERSRSMPTRNEKKTE
jgi:hypothetical protein